MKASKKDLKDIHVEQLGQFACGIACLSSICKYYGKNMPQEQIREISGTTLEGTTLLGLYQAAQALQFQAKGFEGSMDQLQSLDHPVILHVLMDGNREHFVVYYGTDGERHVVSDPGWGIVEYSNEELEAIWKSKYLLSIKPGKDFVSTKESAVGMREWFKTLIKEDVSILSVAAVIGIIIAALGLSTAIFAQKLIDDFLPNHNMEKILLGFGALGLLLVARSFLGYLRGLFMARQGRDLNLRIVRAFLTKIIRLPLGIVKGYSTGDLIARLNDSTRIRSTVALISGDLLINAMVILTSCVYIFYMSWLIGAVSVTSIALFIAVGLKFSPKLLAIQKDLMSAHSANESQYIDTLSGLPTIKSYGKEHSFEYRVNKMYELYQNKGYAVEMLSTKFSLIVQLIAGSYITLIFGMGVWQVFNEHLLLGELMALLTVAGSMIPALGSVIMANVSIQGAKVAFQRMYEISSMTSEYTEQQAVTYHANDTGENDTRTLQLSNLTFRFPGKRPLLQSLDLELSKGEAIALFGQIGSGKSTLVDILQQFYKPESGIVSLNNKPCGEWPIAEWRERIGVVRQEEKIFNSTIIDNICLSHDTNDIREAIDYLQKTGFGQLFADLPQGYRTLCGEDGRYLSGGQKQLVALARAINKHPDFLILDESTSAMDFETEAKVVNILRKFVKEEKFGLMMVTHRIQLASMSERILLLKAGAIELSGTHQELIAGKNFYADGYLQFTRQEAVAVN